MKGDSVKHNRVMKHSRVSPFILDRI